MFQTSYLRKTSLLCYPLVSVIPDGDYNYVSQQITDIVRFANLSTSEHPLAIFIDSASFALSAVFAGEINLYNKV